MGTPKSLLRKTDCSHLLSNPWLVSSRIQDGNMIARQNSGRGHFRQNILSQRLSKTPMLSSLHKNVDYELMKTLFLKWLWHGDISETGYNISLKESTSTDYFSLPLQSILTPNFSNEVHWHCWLTCNISHTLHIRHMCTPVTIVKCIGL